jgi:hypothetical protein
MAKPDASVITVYGNFGFGDIMVGAVLTASFKALNDFPVSSVHRYG